MKEKLMALTRKKQALESKLVAPARAAANQMKDAGMGMGADPLLQVLFEIDACDAELKDLLSGDPEEVVTAMLELLGGGKKP